MGDSVLKMFVDLISLVWPRLEVWKFLLDPVQSQVRLVNNAYIQFPFCFKKAPKHQNLPEFTLPVQNLLKDFDLDAGVTVLIKVNVFVE